jgi:hypothetical protein
MLHFRSVTTGFGFPGFRAFIAPANPKPHQFHILLFFEKRELKIIREGDVGVPRTDRRRGADPRTHPQMCAGDL